MQVQLDHDFLAWMRENPFHVPRLWLILAVVVVSWLVVGLVVFAIYNLAT